MFEESFSLWASMNSWLTPTVLFVFLNIMIGTIAVTSGLTSKPSDTTHLSRSPSTLLHRLRSIKLHRSALHPPSEPLFYHPLPDPDPLLPAPDKGQNAPVDREAVIVQREEEETEEEEDDDEEGPTMEEVFSRIQQGNSVFGRSKSDGGHIPAPKKVRKRIIKKAASDIASVIGGFETVAEEQIKQWDDGVDGKAEDFIYRFRQQLDLQRQESLYGAAA